MLKALHTEEKVKNIVKHKQKTSPGRGCRNLNNPIPPGGFRTVFNCGNIVSSVNAQTPNLLKERHHAIWGSRVVFFVVKKGELQ